MADRLTGDRLIEKVREISDSSDDERALKSRICVGCGYVHDNGLPDFVGFYNALKEAKGETESPEKETVSPERMEELTSEIKDELGEYAEYLVERNPEDVTAYIDKKIEPRQSKRFRNALERLEKKIASSYQSGFQLRLRLAKVTGIDILLSDEMLLELAEFFDERDQDERELQVLSKILRRSPQNQDALFNRANTLQNIFERYDEAIKDWTLLLEVGDNKYILKHRAECFLEVGELEKAQKDAKEVFSYRPNNYIAQGAFSVLSKIEAIRGQNKEAARYSSLAADLDDLEPREIYVDKSQERTYKLNDFDERWRQLRDRHYKKLKELEDFPLDIDSFCAAAKETFEEGSGERLEAWEIEAVCVSAIDELWNIPFMYEDEEGANRALRRRLENTIRHFIANVRRSWAEAYITIAIELIALARSAIKGTELQEEKDAAHSYLVHSVLTDVYKEITDECESHIDTMNQVVKLAKIKSPFADRPDPVLRKEDIEDGRLSVYWEEGIDSSGLDWALGKSLVYLVDFEGDAYIPRFEDTMTFSDKSKLPYIAATIVQDIYGYYDRENTVALIEAIKHFGPIAENAGSIEEIFDSVKEAAEEDGFFELTETTDTLKAFLTAIAEDPALEELLRAVKNPLQIIQIAERHGFQGLTPEALEKAWFGEPVIPDYLFHHFKRRGAEKSTSMLLYEAQGELFNAMKRGDEEKVSEARKQVMELEKIMKMDSSEWTKQYLKKRLND